MLPTVERKWCFPTPGHQRVLKLRGDAQQIFVNGEFSGNTSGFWDYTIYMNPYMVLRPEGHYTKHIYVNSQRIASKIGNPEDYAGGDPTTQGSSVGKKGMLEEVVEENFNELFGSIPEIDPARRLVETLQSEKRGAFRSPAAGSGQGLLQIKQPYSFILPHKIHPRPMRPDYFLCMQRPLGFLATIKGYDHKNWVANHG